MFYREDKHGQILQEGINEPGAISSWIAAATSYANHGLAMVPFYVYYSMFGFQRVGDLAWAAGDSRARGFLRRRDRGAHDAQRRGAAARGRPQPHAGVADPELRRLRPGLRLRARGDRPGRPAADVRRAGGRLLLPDDHERELRAAGDAGGRGGGHPARHAPRRARRRGRRRRCSCSARARSCARCSPAPSCCAEDYGVEADVWSVTSFTELRRDGIDGRAPQPPASRPEARRASFVEQSLGGRAARSSPRPTTSARCPTASAPGSTRRTRCSAPTASAAATTASALRRFFEVDRHHVVLAALRRARPATTTRARRSSATASTPTRRRRGGGDPGHGPRHRGLRGRRGDRGARRRRATASRPRTRWSRSSPTRRRWTSRRRSAAWSRRSCSRSATRPPRARRSLKISVNGRAAPADGAAAQARAGAAAEATAEPRRPRRRRPRRRGRAGGARARRAARGAAARPPHRPPARRARLREPVRAAPRARARRRPRAACRAPAARAASRRRTSTRGRGRPRRRAGAARRRRAGPRPAAVAAGRLREVRRGRARAAHAGSRSSRGGEPRAQLGRHPARHPQRRGGHHRARGVPQAAQRRADRRQGDDGRAAAEGVRGDARGVPATSTPRSTATSSCVKRYYNLGFAADTPNGLVVPVVKDVDRKGLLELAGELTELSGKARAGKLGPARDERRRRSRSRASAASAARRSRRSSTRPRWRSSASCARR